MEETVNTSINNAEAKAFLTTGALLRSIFNDRVPSRTININPIIPSKGINFSMLYIPRWK